MSETTSKTANRVMTTIYFDRDQKEKMDAIAEELNISANEVARRAVQFYLDSGAYNEQPTSNLNIKDFYKKLLKDEPLTPVEQLYLDRLQAELSRNFVRMKPKRPVTLPLWYKERQPKCVQPVMVKGIGYPSMADATRATGICHSTIRCRINAKREGYSEL